ncbi:MAG: beta-lactamase family protein [Proteobacteria bacterium]|nr:beta-lactamase family protein [Pseudomonadota bacterium]
MCQINGYTKDILLRKSYIHYINTEKESLKKIDRLKTVDKMKKMIQSLFVFFLTIPVFWNITSAAGIEPDYWPTNGWRTASPESQGVDSKALINLLDTIWEKNINIDSVLAVRNGYIVLDDYVYPLDSDTRHSIYSCTKSISSALIGIALDKGHIKDVQQSVLDFFPKREVKNIDARKKAITLENLLTMTTGIDCRDSYLYQWRGLTQMNHSADWVQFMIDLPMSEEPGTRFEYCNGASFLLSAIIQKQTGMTAFSFAQKTLFGPLGLTNVRWPSSPNGISIGYGEIQMRPVYHGRTQAKFIGCIYREPDKRRFLYTTGFAVSLYSSSSKISDPPG